MAKSKISPEQKARMAQLGELMAGAGIKTIEDIQELFKDMNAKILSMYAKGMTIGNIEGHIKEIYGLGVSDSAISRITDKILPVVREWQARPLQEIYAVVYMDVIHFHVRAEGQIVKKAVYIVLGLDMEGRRDVLGMYIGEDESAKFWLTVLNNLKNRGVEDMLIVSVDGLTGFPDAIEAVYPRQRFRSVSSTLSLRFSSPIGFAYNGQ